MTSLKRFSSFCLVVAWASGLATSPAAAQADPAAELDLLAQATTEIAPGMALAREQAAAGDLVGAAATLERILMAHPEADEARLMHAGLLCRLDDPEGARAELDQLAGRSVDDGAWSEVLAACGPVPRPVAESANGETANMEAAG